MLEDYRDLLLISLISPVRKLLLWLARTLLFYFVEASNLSQALQQECNCRFAATASILKLFAEGIELLKRL